MPEEHPPVGEVDTESAAGGCTVRSGRPESPVVDRRAVDGNDVKALDRQILASGVPMPQLVSTACAAAAAFRGSDKRGANGERIGLQRAAKAAGYDSADSARNDLSIAFRRFSSQQRHRAGGSRVA